MQIDSKFWWNGRHTWYVLARPGITFQYSTYTAVYDCKFIRIFKLCIGLLDGRIIHLLHSFGHCSHVKIARFLGTVNSSNLKQIMT